MGLQAISLKAWDVAQYFVQKNRFDALRGIALFGKYVNFSSGVKLGKSPLVKRCSSALSTVYPLEFFSDLIKLGKEIKEEKSISLKVFDEFAFCVEAFPRAYDIVADVFGWNKESLPGGKTTRTLGDVAGMYSGGKIAFDSMKTLRKTPGDSEKKLTTNEKLEQAAWIVFGAGWSLSEGLCLLKTFEIVPAKKVPAWANLATGTFSTLGFLTATYLKNNKGGEKS